MRSRPSELSGRFVPRSAVVVCGNCRCDPNQFERAANFTLKLRSANELDAFIARRPVSRAFLGMGSSQVGPDMQTLNYCSATRQPVNVPTGLPLCSWCEGPSLVI